MRNFHSRRLRYLKDLSREKSKTFYSRTFFTAFKHQLQSQADAKKRSPFFYNLFYHIHQSILMQTVHGIPKGTYAWKDHFVSS